MFLNANFLTVDLFSQFNNMYSYAKISSCNDHSLIKTGKTSTFRLFKHSVVLMSVYDDPKTNKLWILNSLNIAS